MNIDPGRWQRLLEALEETKALRRGLVAELRDLQGRTVEAANKLGALETRYEHRYGPLPAAAALDQYQGHAPRHDQQWRRHANDEARAVIEGRMTVAELTSQQQRYEARLQPIRQRFAELDQLVRRCREWAEHENIPLPGVDLVTAPMAGTLQDAGGRALNLGNGPITAAGPRAGAARAGFFARAWLGGGAP